MLCPKCGFKNSKNTSYCIKCNRKLKNSKSRNSLLILLKILLLIIAVTGISEMVSAYPLAEHSTYPTSQIGNAQNETVYIENGFSGIVTIKDTQRNVITVVNVDYKASGSGSGLIVTPNGYIITAFHVVSDPIVLDRDQTMKKVEDKDTKLYVEKEALKKYINENPQLGYKLLKNRPKSLRKDLKSDKNIDYLTKIFIKKGWISTGSYQYDIYVRDPAWNGNPLKARIVDFGDYKKDEDIALLKIDPQIKNLPVFTINSKYQKINESMRIYGYPGDKIDLLENKSLHKNESIAPSQIYTPSLVFGQLTAKTPNPQGIIYYETNAVTTEGYSGGPVVDNQNRVLGILIYGLYGENKFKNASKKRTEIGDGSLFLPSNYIIKICKKNKIPIQSV